MQKIKDIFLGPKHELAEKMLVPKECLRSKKQAKSKTMRSGLEPVEEMG